MYAHILKSFISTDWYIMIWHMKIPNRSMCFSWSCFCCFHQAVWMCLLWPWESSLEALWWKGSNWVCLVQPRWQCPPVFSLLFSCWASTSCTVEIHRWQGSLCLIRGKYNPNVCLYSLLLSNTLKVGMFKICNYANPFDKGFMIPQAYSI